MRAVSIALSSPKSDLSARDCAESYSIYIMYDMVSQVKKLSKQSFIAQRCINFSAIKAADYNAGNVGNGDTAGASANFGEQLVHRALVSFNIAYGKWYAEVL